MPRVATLLAVAVGVAAVVLVLRGLSGTSRKAGKIVFPPALHGVFKHKRL